MKGSTTKIYDKYTKKRCDLLDIPWENESVEYPINRCVIPNIKRTIDVQIICEICTVEVIIYELIGYNMHATKLSAAQKKHT